LGSGRRRQAKELAGSCDAGEKKREQVADLVAKFEAAPVTGAKNLLGRRRKESVKQHVEGSCDALCTVRFKDFGLAGDLEGRLLREQLDAVDGALAGSEKSFEKSGEEDGLGDPLSLVAGSGSRSAPARWADASALHQATHANVQVLMEMIENERAKVDLIDVEICRAEDDIGIAAHLGGGAAARATKRKDSARALQALGRVQVQSLMEMIVLECDSLSDLDVELKEAAAAIEVARP